MTPDEIRNLLTEIGTDDDEVSRRERLATVSEEVRILGENTEKFQKDNNTLNNDNENLRTANMKLFLQLGNGNTNDGEKDTEDEKNKEKENEKRKFENLFNDKGEII